jgi:hypothetical protein
MMYRIVTFTIVFLLSVYGFCQHNSHGALFTTGGTYLAPGNQINLYRYLYGDSSMTLLDSLPGDFSNDVIFANPYAFVHAGRADGSDRIYKYLIASDSVMLIDSTDVFSGIQKMTAHWTDNWSSGQLAFTRGFGATDSFLVVVDATNLSQLLYADTMNVESMLSGIASNDENFFVVSSASSPIRGVIHQYSWGQGLANVQTYYLDSLALGGKDILLRDDYLLTTHEVYNAGFQLEYAGVGIFNLSSGLFSFDTSGFSAASAFAVNDSLLIGNFGSPIQHYDYINQLIINDFQAGYTEAVFDSVRGYFFLQNTDYFSFGELIVYDSIGVQTESFMTDISGAAIGVIYNELPQPTFSGDTMIGCTNLDPVITVEMSDLVSGWDLEIINVLDVDINSTVTYTGDILNYFSGVLTDSVQVVVADYWGDSVTMEIVFDICGSLKSVDKPFSFNVYPNPTNDILFIEGESNTIKSVSVFDLQGREVYRSVENSNITSVDLSDLPTGVYLVQAASKKSVFIEKFFKR